MNKIGRMSNKLFYHTVGRLSTGIRMTLELGLTSGRVLDYIYENKPRGTTFLGRTLDKSYLEHVGWEAVRIRKDNVEAMLGEAIETARRNKKRVKIVDIACGYAAYLFSVLSKNDSRDLHIECYDIDKRWVKFGNAKAAELGMDAIRFSEGNMLDPATARTALKDADIVISSGFYDWIVEDETVQRSLEMIATIPPRGSMVVMTYQMAHPNLELVHYVFSDFRGRGLRMKMRDRDAMGVLLGKAGITVIKEQADEFGYYNTLLGRT